jgi:hypothetical protein
MVLTFPFGMTGNAFPVEAATECIETTIQLPIKAMRCFAENGITFK